MDGVTVSAQIHSLSQSMGGAEGIASLGGVALASQSIARIVASPQFASFVRREVPRSWRLVAVSATSLLGGVAALRLQGISWDAALAHSTTLAAMQVFAHQCIRKASRGKKNK